MIRALAAWWKRQRQAHADAANPESLVVVRFDDEGVVVTPPNAEVQAITWEFVDRVAIETNDSGPWGSDVWWLLEGDGVRVAFPGGATGEQELLAELPQHFPGFRHEAVIAAMGSTADARFVCWTREVDEPTPPPIG